MNLENASSDDRTRAAIRRLLRGDVLPDDQTELVQTIAGDPEPKNLQRGYDPLPGDISPRPATIGASSRVSRFEQGDRRSA